jgi:hypothetical protein
MKLDLWNLPYRTKLWTAVLSFTLGCACTLLMPRAEAPPATTIEIDMMVSQGDLIELYLNGEVAAPLRLPVVAGKRHTYRFERVPKHLTVIRLDPTAVQSAHVLIYSITLSLEGRTVKRFSPSDLQSWQFINLVAERGDPAALAVFSTTDDPILSLSEDVDLVPPPTLLQTLAHVFSGSGSYELTALAVLLIVFVTWPHIDLRARRLIAMRWGLAERIPAFRLLNPTVQPWFLSLLVAAALAAVFLVRAEELSSRTSIDVDMWVGRGDQVELYLNDPSVVPPLQQPVAQNQRQTYRFTRPPSRITMIRLDPTTASDTRVVLYSLRVVIGTRTVQQFGPAELREWRLSGLAPATDPALGLVLDTTNSDPQLSAPVSIELPAPDTLLAQAGDALRGSDSLVLLAMGAFVLIAVFGAVRADGFRELVLFILLAASAHPLLTSVLHIHGSPPPVRAAVGIAAYTGYPKSGDYIAGYVLFGFSIILAIACWRWFSPPRPVETEEQFHRVQRAWNWLGHVLVLLILVLYFMPDLGAALDGLKTVRYAPFAWDDANGFIWNYLVEAGYRPLRDFWYPYSGFYAQMLPFPTGPLIGTGFLVLPLWFLYLGLYYVTGRRFIQSLCAFTLVLIPALMGQMPGSSRYLLAIDTGLLYLAVTSAKRIERVVQILFGACVALAVFCEPTQLVYAAVGIAADLVVVVCTHYTGSNSLYRNTLSILRVRALHAGVPLAVGILSPLAFYTSQGMLSGLWSFEASISDQAAYGAFPARVADWVQPIFAPNTIFLVLFLLIVYSVYRFLRRIHLAETMTVAMLVVCSIGLICMQKQILRPHGMSQIRIYPYIALVLYGLMMWRERPRAARPAIAIFAGAVIAVSWTSSLAPTFYHKVAVETVRTMAGNLDVLLNRGAEVRELHSTRFAPSRFDAFQEQNAVVDIIEKASLSGAPERLYVLGDDPLFYILLKQAPPYLTNGYNMSPIYEQQRTLEWLKWTRPRFVVWSPTNAAYDSTPNVVRLPLVFDYVIRNYGFLSAVGQHHILTRMSSGQIPDVAYWRSTLGVGEDLGSIPSLARLSDFGPCEKEPCQSVFIVKPTEIGAPAVGKASFRIQGDSGDFQVVFNLSPDAPQYVIPTRRLWFSEWLGTAPQFRALDDRLQVSIERRAVTNSALY